MAFSRCSGSAKYERYAQWVKSHYPEVECIDMYRLAIHEANGIKTVDLENALTVLKECSGLIITGGPDIHPARFGKSAELSRCEVQAERDTLEFGLYAAATQWGIPVLAICRGMQLVNVAEGGSLYTDIPTDIGKNVIHRTDTGATHTIQLQAGTYINGVCGSKEGTINSYHHQSVDRVGKGLKVTGSAVDGVVEVLEREHYETTNWLLAVQWHPERLPDQSPFSMNILNAFMQEVMKKEEKE